MPRWVCTVAAAAAWPVAMTIGVVLISPPVLALYEAGLLGTSPSAPMAFISIVAVALSMTLCVSIWALLRTYCEYDERREARKSTGPRPSAG